MRFLHTADLHLKKGAKQRHEIFDWLFAKAEELRVDYMIIAGDLFDSDTDATLLRNEVRKKFESSRFKFLIIPGNHDARSFGSEYDYGSNVVQLVQTPFELLEIQGLRICGVPYQDKRFSESVKSVPGNIDILITHGTIYDPSFIFPLLEDKETEYMPVFPVDLENTARYTAMGHLHAHYIELEYGSTRVVYPGSPIALDTKCQGERYVFLLNIDGNGMEIEKHRVAAPYWVAKDFFVYPQAEQDILSRIADYLGSIDGTHVMLRITVKGYVGEKEKEYLGALAGIQQKYASLFEELRIEPEIQSWDKVITNPLVQSFVAKTTELNDRLRMKVFEITFPIFSKVLK